jgi:hypothetical protein
LIILFSKCFINAISRKRFHAPRNKFFKTGSSNL